jgi:sugar lactone lactonase YvrE
VAGNGTGGYSGDGGLATAAQLKGSSGVSFDSEGNIYIADSGNHRIRKVTTAGIISTVAGNGTGGYSGDGGLATAGRLSFPQGITVDSAGNLYIADTFNHRIRKVTTAGIISSIAGNGTSGYSGDGGLATAGQLWFPQGVSIDSAGNLYIADSGNNRIRKVTTAAKISTVAGEGGEGWSSDGEQATVAQLNDPSGVSVDSTGNLYIAERGNNRILKVSTKGKISTVAGNGTTGYSGDGGSATMAQLFKPIAVAADSADNIFITDQGNHRIRKVMR